MADFYEEMQGVAASLLAEFQQGSISYVELTPGSGPADDPGQSTETVYALTATARGVLFKYVVGDVVASDLQLTMPGGGVEPKMKGFIRVDGKRYKIVQIMRNPAAGTPVAWVVIFRK